VGHAISHCGNRKISFRWDFSGVGSKQVSGAIPPGSKVQRSRVHRLTPIGHDSLISNRKQSTQSQNP
jgi:hypothetical protein